MDKQLKEVKNIKDIQLLYYRYKDTPVFSLGTIVLIIFVSFVLLGRVVIPQVDSWFSIQKEVELAQERIQTMEEMQSFLFNQNDRTLNEQFITISSALPIEKDFAGILTAINAASSIAGVALDDFSFQVGDLSTKSAQLTPQTSLTVGLSLKGDRGNTKRFLKEIAAKVPLSEVVSVDYADLSARVNLLFFYSLLPADVSIVYTRPLPVITDNQSALLRQIGEWREETVSESEPLPVASGIAEPF